MKKKKVVISGNYLEKIPARAESVKWKADSDGLVTLEVENTGWANRIAQAIFFRPKVSYVHLDKLGSFIWQLIDGKRTLTELGASVDETFGEEAHPLYERIAMYFRMLDGYRFIVWVG